MNTIHDQRYNNSINPMFGRMLASVTLTVAAFGAFPTAHAQSTSPAAPMDHSKMMSGKMSSDMGDMKMTGNADHDFAMMMKKHHVDGMEMAKTELAQGKDPAMRKMAQKIIDMQKKEVAQLDKWMAGHKGK